MKNLLKEETSFKARVLQYTSQKKYKLYVYSDENHEEIGIFFVGKEQMKDQIKKTDIENVIQFKGILKEIKGKYYIKEISKIKRERISYSKKERRTALSKYDDNKFHEFTAKFMYKRENDDRSLFTEVKLKPRLQIDHLNLKINKELEKEKIYSFKGKVIKYQKKHTTGFFYSISDIKDISEINSNKTSKKNKKEMISIEKEEYNRLKSIEETLNKLIKLMK